MCTGKNLQAFLKSRNISIAELARETGISSNTLYATMKRNSNINLTTMNKLAEYLGVTVDSLHDLIKQETSKEKEINYQSHNLNINDDYYLLSDTKNLIKELNRLTSEYENRMQHYIQMQKKIETLKKQSASIENELKKTYMEIELLENDLKTRRLELDIIRNKFNKD